MGRKKKKKACPNCGSEEIEAYKTWELIAPMPSFKKGTLTVTVMGMFECKNCKTKFRGVVAKKDIPLGIKGE